MRTRWAAVLAVLSACTVDPDIVAIGTSQLVEPGAPPAVFHTDGATILDPCGKAVIFRGVNEMAAYVPLGDRAGDVWMLEIKKTGGNAVRFWWRAEKIVGTTLQVAETTPDELDALLTNAEAADLTPMPTIHNDDGDWSKLQSHVDAWLRPDILAVVKKHEPYMLLNISDALGVGTNAPDEINWVAGYSGAIGQLRRAGLRLPIVIDAPFRGMNAAPLLSSGQALINMDHNVILSLHMFWRQELTELPHTAADVAATLQAARDKSLPLVVTEFAPWDESCNAGVYYQELMNAAADQAHQTGWMAWSWGAAHNEKCADLDMTTGGLFANLMPWGNIAMTQNIGVSSASRTRYQNNGKCDSL